MESCGVGLGTLGLNESAEASVAAALDMGCNLVDTGEHYGNLDLVGAALAKSSRLPFIIVKVSGMPSGAYESLRERMIAMLTLLRVERADLCLMHWPGLCSWDVTDMSSLTSPADFKGKASSWEEFCDNIGPAWTNMMRLKEEGLCTEIGTSNFYAHHLEELANRCEGAAPYANEIFIDVTNQETNFVTSMQERNIRVLAYRPVAYKPFPDQVKTIADRFGDAVSPQTVVLAWLLRRGIYPLVKCRGQHIEQNFRRAVEVKEALTDVDLEELGHCELDMRLSAEWFAKIWKAHNQTATVSEEDVEMLVAMGVDERKARDVLQRTGGDIDAALDLAFAE